MKFVKLFGTVKETRETPFKSADGREGVIRTATIELFGMPPTEVELNLYANEKKRPPPGMEVPKTLMLKSGTELVLQGKQDFSTQKGRFVIISNAKIFLSVSVGKDDKIYKNFEIVSRDIAWGFTILKNGEKIEARLPVSTFTMRGNDIGIPKFYRSAEEAPATIGGLFEGSSEGAEFEYTNGRDQKTYLSLTMPGKIGTEPSIVQFLRFADEIGFMPALDDFSKSSWRALCLHFGCSGVLKISGKYDYGKTDLSNDAKDYRCAIRSAAFESPVHEEVSHMGIEIDLPTAKKLVDEKERLGQNGPDPLALSGRASKMHLLFGKHPSNGLFLDAAAARQARFYLLSRPKDGETLHDQEFKDFMKACENEKNIAKRLGMFDEGIKKFKSSFEKGSMILCLYPAVTPELSMIYQSMQETVANTYPSAKRPLENADLPAAKK